jgi:uncharacterized protein
LEVQVELARILITELGGEQVIVLREKGGDRSFPIMIGLHEAIAIDHRLKGKPFPRPMTHDLLAGVIKAMGGQLAKIVITDLRDHTFFASLHIQQGNRVLAIDARPSDAIALGVAFETPIFVAEHVLQEVLKPPTTADRVELLRTRMNMLSERIDDLTQRLADDDFVSQAPPAIVDEARRQLDQMKTEYEAIDQVLKKFG